MNASEHRPHARVCIAWTYTSPQHQLSDLKDLIVTHYRIALINVLAYK